MSNIHITFQKETFQDPDLDPDPHSYSKVHVSEHIEYQNLTQLNSTQLNLPAMDTISWHALQ